MISVEEATQRIVESMVPTPSEMVALSGAAGRVLASEARAKLDQPPFSVSAMDGYAVRAADVATAPTTLKVIGVAPAGHPYEGHIGEGQALRIFTGGVVPQGADTIVIQENTTATDDAVIVNLPAAANKNIRIAGLDFRAGDVLAPVGRRLGFRDLALLAGGDLAEVCVRRKPRIAMVATGDELSYPGEPRKPGGIVASTGYGISALIESAGAQTIDLGILPDKPEEIAKLPELAKDADLIVTLGGASVGDHDLVQSALGPQGFALDFWKIAMRPGKPLIFGRLGGTPLLGLPGNPVAAMLCAYLYLRPAIARMLGTECETPVSKARLACDLAANDKRQDHLRAHITTRDGERWARPFDVQDSSMMSVFARCDGLIIRRPFAPPARTGDSVDVIQF